MEELNFSKKKGKVLWSGRPRWPLIDFLVMISWVLLVLGLIFKEYVPITKYKEDFTFSLAVLSFFLIYFTLAIMRNMEVRKSKGNKLYLLTKNHLIVENLGYRTVEEMKSNNAKFIKIKKESICITFFKIKKIIIKGTRWQRLYKLLVQIKEESQLDNEIKDNQVSTLQETNKEPFLESKVSWFTGAVVLMGTVVFGKAFLKGKRNFGTKSVDLLVSGTIKQYGALLMVFAYILPLFFGLSQLD